MAGRYVVEEEHDPFYRVWCELALSGQVDEWGGMQCNRVFREWMSCGQPSPVRQFIIDHREWSPGGDL